MREPIDSFTVDWEGSYADFAQAKLQRPDVEKPDGFLKSLFDWVEGKRFIGAEFKELYQSDIEITGDWRLERPLGRGAFGVVALFKQYFFDEIRDEVVVKDVFRKDHDNHDSKRSLSREAAIMAQTNDLDNESFLRLRAYKYLEDARQYRYFLQNCESGDLELLRLKYKAWQLHIPELFLWHLFSCFSSGHSAMTDGPFRSMRRKTFGKVHEGGYLLHGDIKTSNVFLGPPTKAKRDTRFYPSLKIADFGLAIVLTGPEDPINRAISLNHGTKCWKAPEIRIDQMGCPWQFAPRQNQHADRTAHVITAQTNLFPLAAIIWTFTTGREIQDLDEMIYDKIKYDPPPKTPYVDPEMRASGRAPADYDSSELRVLVRDCLKILPRHRPSPEDLRERLKMGMRNCLAREKAENGAIADAAASRVKIYCEANEINDVPQGKANFELDKVFWQKYAAATLFIPEEWGTLLPPTASSNWEPDRRWPPEIRRRWTDNLRRARINKRRREGGLEELQPVSKRMKVKEVFRNIKNAVPLLRQATTTGRPTLPQQRHVPPAELTETPLNATSDEHDSTGDSTKDEFRRPPLGDFVDPAETQRIQQTISGQKRAFNDSTAELAQHGGKLRTRAQTQPQPQSPAVQPFESANAWAARWSTAPDESEADFEGPLPPTPTRPHRRAHVKRDRAPSRLDRSRGS